ncbi:ATP synthase F1, delta subunit [Wolbachia endosymbiont of Armadillidium vulgare str. wVulC]|uniref:ATP synthase subunit delta n=1 Tax=Wolbachia endosymbiont of Armadillidium arcangelii TaxID=3158571 RepID=A0AAU7Q5B8_9RICK|nr:ATP synthase F1 subunit delta [Wolbachia endosymbiont of Armadillidium vulgare]KLT23216.1 ATP synthase F1, delta subunit [Wolbachia endosymbiont of Armadillidium vulgare str. wVulC]OJH30801.1 ATP synthase subunit delta [Wolbachia endosymbiont of Armadillidium vulgare]OJH31864.1 ATP synthase subunit delta [Wolbachia endosymbiont of Armadillidium vulgare]
MKSNNLVSSYARALFYVSENKLGTIRKEVEFLLAFFKDQHDVLIYLSHPMTSLAKKKEAILSINEKLSENLVKFIMVTLANKRSRLLILILEKFLSLVRESENELEITIKSAEVLKKPDIKIITESLSFLGKIIKVSNVVDPSILGGFVVRYGFNLIDASLKSYLDRLVDLSKMEILKVRNCV